MWGCQASIMRRIVLQNISIDRACLKAMQLSRRQVRVAIRTLPLYSVQASLGSIDLCNSSVGMNALWEVPPSSGWRVT